MIKTVLAIFSFAVTALPAVAQRQLKHQAKPTIMSSTQHHKLTIYQLLPRVFGNTNTTNKFYGSIEENGCGKFNGITDKALQELKALGISHVWYTGVIEHATMTDYSAFGITPDDPDVVKGRAGSPYAVKDYYDVDPDLAVDVNKRMAEYEALIQRTHNNGLKVLMDFVPNHVARTYHSDVMPAGVRDFGADDDKTKAFDPKNDYYYIPGQFLKVPAGYNPGGNDFKSLLKDGMFEENPAKATGNDIFKADPSINDWFETVKLNYGIDYTDNHKTYFNPIPPVWQKMYDILNFWALKGVDGFRCDMVENVPTEFWGWVVTKLKEAHPGLIFMGEAYDKSKYSNYLENGRFDYLYDKSGLYDTVKKLVRNDPAASIWDINGVWNHDTKGIDRHMVRFMENHDEERIASEPFAGYAWYAVPGMIVTATLAEGPVMIYYGQEVGEPAKAAEGFSAADGRTSIFDYWSAPEHAKWVNNGKFDGGSLSAEQKSLRKFYTNLLNAVKNNEALNSGKFYELMLANEQSKGFDTRTYCYLRYTGNEKVLIITNFNREERKMNVKLPADLMELLKVKGTVKFTDMLSGSTFNTKDITSGVDVMLPPTSGVMLEF